MDHTQETTDHTVSQEQFCSSKMYYTDINMQEGTDISPPKKALL